MIDALVNKLKKRDVTPMEVIVQQQQKVDDALGTFTKLRNDVLEANEKLEEACLESQKRKDSLLAQVTHEERTIQLAVDERSANLALLEKIEEFFPKGALE